MSLMSFNVIAVTLLFLLNTVKTGKIPTHRVNINTLIIYIFTQSKLMLIF